MKTTNLKPNLIVRCLLASAAFFPASQTSAQLHEQISVEGRYVPEIIRADRINVFPQAWRPGLGINPLAYEIKGVAASFEPGLLPLPATAWNASRLLDPTRGYLDLGTGSRLNSTLSAGYRFLDSPSSKAGIRLQHNSVSFWKPLGDLDKNKYRYDEVVGLYGNHSFAGVGTLDASLDWHLGCFNYYSGEYRVFDTSLGQEIDKRLYDPTQTLNDVKFHIGWKSTVQPDALGWTASADVRHFGFRALPACGSSWADFSQPSAKGGRETSIDLRGTVSMPWETGSSVALDARLQVILPSEGLPDRFRLEEPMGSIDNYGLLQLTPRYRFNRGMLDIQLGANIDMAFNAGFENDRYAFLHLSPDVRFALQQGQVGLFLNLTGGTQANTLARLYALDYYCLPAVRTTRPEFSPLDASLGVNLGPFSGFSLGLEGRWKKSVNIVGNGLYQYWLDKGYCGAGESNAIWQYGRRFDFMSPEGLSLHGFSVSGRLAYEYGSLFKISARGSWQPQGARKGFFNGYDRPEVTAGIDVEGSPISQLRIGAGLEFRGKRSAWAQTIPWDQSGDGLTVVDGEWYRPMALELDNLALLGFNASWTFNPRFEIWMQATNLLNRKVDFLPMQPEMGLGVTAGLSWRF